MIGWARLQIVLTGALTIFLCSLLLVSCSGGGGGGGGGQVKGESAATILSSSPENGAAGVPLKSPIRVTVSESLDPSSVNSHTVSLWAENVNGKKRIRGRVMYEESGRTITFKLGGLEKASSYSLELTGIKDLSGKELKETVIGFSTFMNPMSRLTRYIIISRGDGSPVERVMADYSREIFNEKGDKLYTIYYNDPGNDGQWFTDDDLSYVDSWHSSYTYNAKGYTVQDTYYDDLGSDGQPFTADDNVCSYINRTYDADGFCMRDSYFKGAGSDGQWFTDDDERAYYAKYIYDAEGYETRSISYCAPGNDGIWFTEDDPMSSYEEKTYDADGNQTRYTICSGSGNDGLWYTSDDEAIACIVSSFDADGNETRSVIYYDGESISQGSMIDDIPIQNYFIKAYNTDGCLEGETEYSDPGNDGQWFTADDTMSNYSLCTYAPNGYLSHRNLYLNPGDDGQWNTADDLAAIEEEYDTTR